MLALLAVAVVAPVGHAAAPEGRAAAKASEREERAASNRQRREQERARRRQERPEKHRSKWPTEKVRHDGAIESRINTSCTAVTVSYKGFPDAPGNTVTEIVTIQQVPTVVKIFTFDGPTGEDTIPIVAPYVEPPHYHVDLRSKWKTNGANGGFDQPTTISCPPAPAFNVEKLQSIGGSPFTAGPLTGTVGQKVEYEMVATNTGNVPLSIPLTAVTDPKCDPDTLALHSGTNPVPLGGSIVLTCSHILTTADQATGSYTNTATITGTPTLGGGSPIGNETNTVVVTPVTGPGEEEHKEEHKNPPPAVEPEKPPAIGVSPSGPTASQSTTGSKTGVLGFASAAIPPLKGPQGCVRTAFKVSIKSKGVSSVTFYLDGHRLKRLTSKNARKGLLSVVIDGSRLKVGVHRVMARINMARASASVKAVSASRTLRIVRCGSAVITPHFTG